MVFSHSCCIHIDNTQSQHFTVSIIRHYTLATHRLQEHPASMKAQRDELSPTFQGELLIVCAVEKSVAKASAKEDDQPSF